MHTVHTISPKTARARTRSTRRRPARRGPEGSLAYFAASRFGARRARARARAARAYACACARGRARHPQVPPQNSKKRHPGAPEAALSFVSIIIGGRAVGSAARFSLAAFEGSRIRCTFLIKIEKQLSLANRIRCMFLMTPPYGRNSFVGIHK